MRLWLALLSCLVFVGCDPGWRYQAGHSAASVAAPASGPIRVEFVRASVFSASFYAAMRVVNVRESAIVIDALELIVRDAGNDLLPRDYANGCRGPDGGGLRLAPAAACEAHSTFRVNPLVWWRANPQLRTLSVDVNATVDGGAVRTTLSLEKDLR